jgi:hypothetical protein
MRRRRFGLWLALPVVDVSDIFDLNRLLVLMLLAIGLALVFGNGAAIIQARRGRKPKDEEGELHRGRAWWLLAVGVMMTVWGLASL